MKGLMEEFEEWLKQQSKDNAEDYGYDDYSTIMAKALEKLEELKKKYGV